MAYRAKTIAEYFLLLAKEQGEAITPLKMQKLIYFAHGWNLAIQGVPLVNEDVKAWPYGPVIPSIYAAYKKYGRLAIPADKECEKIDEGLQGDTSTTTILNKVWDVYRKFTAFQLSNMTHEPGTPWQKTNTEDTISNEEIRKYFLEQGRQNKDKAHT